MRDSSEGSVAAVDLRDGREAIRSWPRVLHVSCRVCAGFRSASRVDPKPTGHTKATNSTPLAMVLRGHVARDGTSHVGINMALHGEGRTPTSCP